jgi:hypothetical protein
VRDLVARARAGRRRRAGASLLAAGILAGGLAACGGGGRTSESAQALVKNAFASPHPISSGRLDLTLALTTSRASGSHAAGDAFLLALRGPFQSLGPSRLPRFDLAVKLRSGALAGRTLRATVTSTGGQLFIGLDRRQFLASAATLRALQQGYIQASGPAASAGGSSLATVGLDPGAWLVHPRIAGSSRLDGVDVVHLVAGLNVARFLADARPLSSSASAIGGGAGAQSSPLLGPARGSLPAGAVRVARVDLFTGKRDDLPRRLSLRLAVAATPRTQAALGDVRRATLRLVVALSDLNRPQKIVAPTRPRPASELAPLLARLGLAGRSPTGG